MKTNHLVAFLLLLLITSACKKLKNDAPVIAKISPLDSVWATDTTAGVLTTKWHLVRDTIHNIFQNFVINDKNYIGVASDYFDFRSDGHCYIREGKILDTPTYYMYNDTTILIADFGATAIIKPFTAHTANITTKLFIGPSGSNWRTVYLRR